MINLPSLETQGMVPCWKKVTCNTTYSITYYETDETDTICQTTPTWSASNPKYL